MGVQSTKNTTMAWIFSTTAATMPQIGEKTPTERNISVRTIAKIQSVRCHVATTGCTHMSEWAHDSMEGRDVSGDLHNRAHTRGILCKYSWRTYAQ